MIFFYKEWYAHNSTTLGNMNFLYIVLFFFFFSVNTEAIAYMITYGLSAAARLIATFFFSLSLFSHILISSNPPFVSKAFKALRNQNFSVTARGCQMS